MAQSFPLSVHDFQVEMNKLLKDSGLQVVCSRRVATNGDCFYDTVLALLEDGAIRQNIAFRAKDIHTVEDLRRAIAHFMKTGPK